VSREEEETLPPAPPPPPQKRVLGVPLVPDVRNWRHWWSMRLIIAGAWLSGVSAAYLILPPQWLPAVPEWFVQVHALGALLCGGAAGVARVIQQAPKP
jgi:hypothetical protein